MIVVGIRVWQSNLPAKVVDFNKLLQIRVNYDNLRENMFLIKNWRYLIDFKIEEYMLTYFVIPPTVHVCNCGSRPFNLIPTYICLLNSHLPKENSWT